jgi:hypothetical protein
VSEYSKYKNTAEFANYYEMVENTVWEAFGGYVAMDEYFNTHRHCDDSLEQAVRYGFEIGLDAGATARCWYFDEVGTRPTASLKRNRKPRAVDPTTIAREARRQAWRSARMTSRVPA